MKSHFWGHLVERRVLGLNRNCFFQCELTYNEVTFLYERLCDHVHSVVKIVQSGTGAICLTRCEIMPHFLEKAHLAVENHQSDENLSSVFVCLESDVQIKKSFV